MEGKQIIENVDVSLLPLTAEDFLFYRSLERVMQLEFVVGTTLENTVSEGLSQLAGASSKAAFVCGLV